MTCIVATIKDGTVYMGADSASSNYYSTGTTKDKKIFRNGDFLFGCCGSWRIMQLLKHSLTIPRRHADDDLYKFMVKDFCSAVRTTLKDGGCAKSEDSNTESFEGQFLVADSGRVFKIQSDYGVLEYEREYLAAGSGEDYALGSFHTTSAMDMEPNEKLRLALEAASFFSTTVGAPFFYESI